MSNLYNTPKQSRDEPRSPDHEILYHRENLDAAYQVEYRNPHAHTAITILREMLDFIEDGFEKKLADTICKVEEFGTFSFRSPNDARRMIVIEGPQTLELFAPSFDDLLNVQSVEFKRAGCIYFFDMISTRSPTLQTLAHALQFVFQKVDDAKNQASTKATDLLGEELKDINKMTTHYWSKSGYEERMQFYRQVDVYGTRCEIYVAKGKENAPDIVTIISTGTTVATKKVEVDGLYRALLDARVQEAPIFPALDRAEKRVVKAFQRMLKRLDQKQSKDFCDRINPDGPT